MKCQILKPLKADGGRELKPGDIVDVPVDVAIPYIERGKLLQLLPEEPINVISWLEKLSSDEREVFEERSAIAEYDAKIPREIAEVLAIKKIIAERVISGKCDKCERVEVCMMIPAQRQLCSGPFLGVWR